MLVLWGLITLNSMIFLHAHRLSNGRIVIHTHPYKLTANQGPIPTNPHTSFELFWLDMCTHAPYLIGPDAVTISPVVLVCTLPEAVFSYTVRAAGHTAFFSPLRGPPAPAIA
ncbi:hypothetical protein GCM10027578_33840 [Spirosoma luteolum]